MSRLSEILKVKEGQYFTVKNTDRRFKFHYNKVFEYTFLGHLTVVTDADVLIWLIENYKEIKILSERPKITKQEAVMIKGRIAEGCRWLARDVNGDLYFYDEKPIYKDSHYINKNGNRFNTDSSLYEFVKPKQCIYLLNILDK